MIQEGLIWTCYDCSNICYLFGKFELPCIVMTLSTLIFALILIGLILFAIRKLALKTKTTYNTGKEKQ